MEFAQLRHFTVVAAEMNFSRAARILGVTQPSLSRSIRNLEKSLGVPLLHRTEKRIALTPAGNVFLSEAQATLNRASLARNIAQRVGKGETGRIRIGLVPNAHGHGVPQCISEFHRKHPHLELSFDYLPNAAQPEALVSGAIDLGFFHPLQPRLEDLCVHVLGRTNYVAAVPSNWPQARRRRLRLADLAECPFVFRSLDDPSKSNDRKIAACRAAGFTPRIVQETNDVECLKSLVACEVGVAFVANPGRLPAYEGVTFMTIADLPDYLDMEFVMAWVPRGESTPLKALTHAVEHWARSKSQPHDAPGKPARSKRG